MARTPEKSRPAAARLHSEACPTCGTIMKPSRGAVRLLVNGEEVSVPQVEHLRCPSCKEVLLPLEAARRQTERAFTLHRQKHGLLSASDIRAIRRRFELTQADLAHLLRLGQNTVSRWEAGRNVQTGAMDVLLRLLRDVPGSLEYLRKHAA
ncbi:MAG: type II TA system antitoxin MqsA family protein [Polyangiaceae bacterium]